MNLEGYERLDGTALEQLGTRRLAKIAFAQRWLLKQCREVMDDEGIAYAELRAYVDGRMSTDDLFDLIPRADDEN